MVKAAAGELESAYQPLRLAHRTANVKLPTQGYEIWARAVDSSGKSQPFAAANWNPQGYGANAHHRVAVLVEA